MTCQFVTIYTKAAKQTFFYKKSSIKAHVNDISEKLCGDKRFPRVITLIILLNYSKSKQNSLSFRERTINLLRSFPLKFVMEKLWEQGYLEPLITGI